MSDALQTRLAMQPYNEQTAALFVVSHSDDWLHRKQGLALPAIPLTTSEAHRYFVKICEYAAAASASGHGKSDYEAFAREQNQSANRKDQYYVTTEVLSAYAKLGRNSTMSEPLKKLHQ